MSDGHVYVFSLCRNVLNYNKFHKVQWLWWHQRGPLYFVALAKGNTRSFIAVVITNINSQITHYTPYKYIYHTDTHIHMQTPHRHTHTHANYTHTHSLSHTGLQFRVKKVRVQEGLIEGMVESNTSVKRVTLGVR